MFNQVLAIDVDQRVDNFADEMKKISRKTPVVLRNGEDFGLGSDQNVDGIAVSIYCDLSEEFLSQFSNLKYIGVLGSSTKKIPLQYCAERNIKVLNVVDYCDHETAEWVILQTLKFFREPDQPHSCYEKSLGIVGVGAVGTMVAKLALALGMRVYFNEPGHRPELSDLGAHSSSKEEIFSRCHVISCHTPAHFAWLDARLLELLGQNARLINTCMGEIIPPEELLGFFNRRPDVVMAVDGVARQSYPNLGWPHFVDKNPAWLTPESRKRLQEKFWANFTG